MSLSELSISQLSKLNWSRGLPAALALSGLVAIVLSLDLPRGQELAALGAGFATSTGQGKSIRNRRWPVTFLDIAGKLVGIFAGMIAAKVMIGGVALSVPGMLLGAFAVGLLSRRDMSLWWIFLQSWLFFSLSTFLVQFIPSPGPVLLAVGGAMVWVLAVEEAVRVIWKHFAPKTGPKLDGQVPPDGVAPLNSLIGQGLQAMGAVGLSYGIAVAFSINHPYWAPLSALLMLRPRPGMTWDRVLVRSLATLAGGVGASLLVLWLGPDSVVMPGLYVIFGVTAILFAPPAHYPTFVAFLTALIVVMVSMGNDAPLSNAWGRIAGTVLGGASALAMSYLAHAIRKRLGWEESLPESDAA